VAELLGVPTSWVYAETRAGRLPHVRVGRYRRFRRSAVEQWIEAHERGPVR
jgi:excisionase family DNA binding protein